MPEVTGKTLAEYQKLEGTISLERRGTCALRTQWPRATRESDNLPPASKSPQVNSNYASPCVLLFPSCLFLSTIAFW